MNSRSGFLWPVLTMYFQDSTGLILLLLNRYFKCTGSNRHQKHQLIQNLKHEAFFCKNDNENYNEMSVRAVNYPRSLLYSLYHVSSLLNCNSLRAFDGSLVNVPSGDWVWGRVFNPLSVGDCVIITDNQLSLLGGLLPTGGLKKHLCHNQDYTHPLSMKPCRCAPPI